MNSKHYTHRSSKIIKTLQMSSYVYIQCCNDVQIVKVQKGKLININMNSQHYTHRSSKIIKTLQMSYYVYIQCCNDVQMVKVQKGK